MSAGRRPSASAAALTGAALLLMGAAASGPAGASTGSAPGASGSLAMQLPSGWLSRKLPGGGLVAAPQGTALGQAVPSAAKFVEQPVASTASNLKALLAGIDRASFVGAPTTYRTTVDGQPAQYVQWTAAEKSGNETTRTIIVTLPTGSAYVFTLEAPAAKWSPSFPAFDAILASVKLP